MNNTILSSKLNIFELSQLNKAFIGFISDQGLSGSNEKIAKHINIEFKPYIKVFLENPSVFEIYERYKEKSKKTAFTMNSDDIGKLKKTSQPQEFDENTRIIISNLKGRFLIFILELKGYYHRPIEYSTDLLFHAVKQEIYKENDLVAKDLDKRCNYFGKKSKIEGTYTIKRRSFNSSKPNSINVFYLTITKEESNFSPDSNHHTVYKYQTLNFYEQELNGKKEIRKRMSKGYVFNYQGHLFFLGGVSYSHIDDAEGTHDYNNYPEIMLCRKHGGDSLYIRGLILAHLPFLQLPVCTRVLISKLDDSEKTRQFLKPPTDEMMEKMGSFAFEENDEVYEEFLKWINETKVLGNFNINDLFGKTDTSQIEGEEERKNRLKRFTGILNEEELSFINNKIEDSYSKMLTP